jgi:hypothetical protein
LDIAASNAAWNSKREDVLSSAAMVNARVEAIPFEPLLSSEEISRAHLLVSDGVSWRPLEEVTSLLRARVSELAQAQTPTVEETTSEAVLEVERLSVHVAEQNTKRMSFFRARQNEGAQRVSIAKRLAALEEDLQKNLDAQKLRTLGSQLADSVAPDHCPTCTQPIADTLLAQRAGAEVMPVEQNIEYIRAQRGIFQRLASQTEVTIADLDQRLTAAASDINEASARL